MDPTGNWPAIITSLAAAIVVVLQWRAGNREKTQHKKLDQVVDGQREVLKAVNGPAGIVLASLADALAKIARMTQSDTDILAAAAAKRASDEHNEAARITEARRLEDEAKNRKTIEDFKAGVVNPGAGDSPQQG